VTNININLYSVIKKFLSGSIKHERLNKELLRSTFFISLEIQRQFHVRNDAPHFCLKMNWQAK